VIAATTTSCTGHSRNPWASPDAVLVLRAAAPREEWLAARRRGIGSSDASAVLGLSRYTSPYEVWCEKRGLLPPEPDNIAAEFGRLLEPVIADRWAELHGICIRRAGLMASRERPWQIASVDRLTSCTGLLEIKTLGWRVAEEWEEGQTPDHAEVQVQHQLAVTGRDHAHVVGLQDGRTWLERTIARDDELIPDMTGIEAEFWRMVREGVEPPIDGSAPTTEALNRRWPVPEDVERDLTDEAVWRIQARNEALREAANAALIASQLENEIRALMGEATVGWLPGQDDVDPKKRKAVTWRRNGTFRAKDFTADNPELAAAITHPLPALDVAALKGGAPETYAAYRSRVLRLPKL
jgi:putative phage-type endonuclease